MERGLDEVVNQKSSSASPEPTDDAPSCYDKFTELFKNSWPWSLIFSCCLGLILVAAIAVLIYVLSANPDELNKSVCDLCVFGSTVPEICYVINYLQNTETQALLYYLCFTSREGFINSGTPNYIDTTTDCAIRRYAYEYGKLIQPRHGSFVTLFDALQLHACGDSLSSEPETSSTLPIFNDTVDGNGITQDCVYYVSPNETLGNDFADGLTPQAPFLTLQRAINATRLWLEYGFNESDHEGSELSGNGCIINLLAGTYYLSETVSLHYGFNLTIQNYLGAEAILSGARVLQWENSSDWTQYSFEKMKWKNFTGVTNVLGPSSNGDRIENIAGYYDSFEDCFSAVTANDGNNGQYKSLTYDGIDKTCYAVRDLSWQPVRDSTKKSSRLIGSNIWMRKVSNMDEFQHSKFYGLRINNERGILARFPDSDPEIGMQYNPWSGWISVETQTTSKPRPESFFVVRNVSHYNTTNDTVDWPMYYPDQPDLLAEVNVDNSGMGAWGNFMIGVGGPCTITDDFTGGVDPPYGYFCSNKSSRVRTSGGIGARRSPDSFYINETNVPSSVNWTSQELSDTCIIQAFRPGQWYSSMFECGEFNETSGQVFLKRGGFQGSQGDGGTGYWYIENIFKELTMPNEYFFDEVTSTLYYFYNNTDISAGEVPTAPPTSDTFSGTNLDVLIDIYNSSDITIRGLTFRDTRYTYLDNHGLPSGGDWALSRTGAILLRNTTRVTIESNYFTRIDGNGIFLSGFNRYTNIIKNEFEWIGESAMAAWGYTSGLEDLNVTQMGPDGRNGLQPRFTYVSENLVREYGIWEKQTSAWFQAESCQTTIENNIVFNGPRAHINFNDGFGGGNEIVGNLLLNSCRQTADHGVFNSWDRVPYITNVRTGYASIVPEWNTIHNNFMMGTYFPMVVVDNDDGSAYYQTYDNFIVYSGFGLKSDYGGHDNWHFGNIYAYVIQSMFNSYQMVKGMQAGISSGNSSHDVSVQDSGANDMFQHNHVILTNACGYQSSCNLSVFGSYNMTVENNTIYVKDAQIGCVCGMDFTDWQQSGNDQSTTVREIPTDDELIKMARLKLEDIES